MGPNSFFFVEDDPHILDFKDSEGVPEWLFMRHEFFEKISTRIFSDYSVPQDRHNGTEAVKYIIKACMYNFLQYLTMRKSVDFCFYTISREVLRDKYYFNQYTDDYAARIEKNSISIQHPPFDWKWKFPRKNNKVIFSAPALAYASFIAKRKIKSIPKVVNDLFDYANNRVVQEYGFSLTEEEKRQIVYACAYEKARNKSYTKWLLKICKRYGVHCFIMLGGSYSWYYEIIKTLKDNKVITADLQHGWISKTNLVYNYSNSIISDMAIRKSAPDYFLTYGKFWNNQTNIPYKQIIPLGNPFRDNEIKSIKHRNCKIITLIGCSRNTKEYIELGLQLKRAFSDYEIVFRPHPTERVEVGRIDFPKDKLRIDFDGDLYDLLSTSEVLIAEISTVIFEATGIVPQIAVWRTKQSNYCFPDCPYSNFETIKDLVNLIESQSFMHPKVNECWATDWETNFDAFVYQVEKKIEEKQE